MEATASLDRIVLRKLFLLLSTKYGVCQNTDEETKAGILTSRCAQCAFALAKKLPLDTLIMRRSRAEGISERGRKPSRMLIEDVLMCCRRCYWESV